MISLTGETQYVANGIVSRTVMRSPGVRVVLFGFAAGQELSEHTAPHQALVQALSGECEFRVGATEYRMRAGDLLVMPPGAPHGLRAVTEFSMLLTLVMPVPAVVPGRVGSVPLGVVGGPG